MGIPAGWGTGVTQKWIVILPGRICPVKYSVDVFDVFACLTPLGAAGT